MKQIAGLYYAYQAAVSYSHGEDFLAVLWVAMLVALIVGVYFFGKGRGFRQGFAQGRREQ